MRIPRWHEKAGFPLDDELRDPADTRGHDGQSGGHGLEDRERKAFGAARQHEQVGPRQELADVVPLAGEANHRLQTEPADLALDSGPVGAVACDHRLARSPQLGERTDERDRILRRLKPADRHQPARPGAILDGCPRKLDSVVDHYRRRLVAGPGLEAGAALALRDTDRHCRQRAQSPLRDPIHGRARPTVRRKRPAVDRVDADRDTREPGGEASQRARLCAVDVNDVRPFSPYRAP